ncbi:unnamed protein product [Gadus morhua 'NCC']
MKTLELEEDSRLQRKTLFAFSGCIVLVLLLWQNASKTSWPPPHEERRDEDRGAERTHPVRLDPRSSGCRPPVRDNRTGGRVYLRMLW